MITIHEARKIITQNPARPVATHVAVRDGRILGAGSLSELAGWGEYRLDRTFADKVLMPGFVEGHSHVAEGVLCAGAVNARAIALDVEMPITESVVQVLEGQTTPIEAIAQLMGRSARAEG